MCQVTIYSCRHDDCPFFTTAHVLFCEGVRSKRTFAFALTEHIARFNQREGIRLPAYKGCTGLEIGPYPDQSV
ncbi:hypothetical protein Neosp_011751 [[Neocosmospora] mangrovei]